MSYFSKFVSLINVYQHTVNHCMIKKYHVIDPIKYSYDDKEFSDEIILSKKIPYDNLPTIIVENMDTFDMAQKLHDPMNISMVLNLASNIYPGGGVKKGSRAQEEDLFRKSNYFQATDEKIYPLKFDEVVYSQIVHVVKDSAYHILEQPFAVSCLAVAAIRNPKLVLSDGKETYSRHVDWEIMQEKINIIFKIAIKHDHKNIILGALGCGVFKNPPEQVAEMFKHAIQKYGKFFKTIAFAILSGKNNSNYDIFNKILK